MELGQIIVADDQKINLEAIKLSLFSVGIEKNVTYCADGEQAYNEAINLANQALALNSEVKLKPIVALFLDI